MGIVDICKSTNPCTHAAPDLMIMIMQHLLSHSYIYMLVIRIYAMARVARVVSMWHQEVVTKYCDVDFTIPAIALDTICIVGVSSGIVRSTAQYQRYRRYPKYHTIP
jgi:hypothetical protein